MIHDLSSLCSTGTHRTQTCLRFQENGGVRMFWPPASAKNTTLFLQENHTLSESQANNSGHQLKYIPTIGVEAGFWWGELLSDPRPVDAFSLVYDSAPLESELAILGRPH